MKIITNIYNKYNEILAKYNEVAKKTFQDIITEAVQNALEHADWTRLKAFRYKKTPNDDGYFWKTVFYEFEYELYKELQQQYMKNGITIDDIVNFALLFSQKFLLLKYKKEIIDKKWDAERVTKVIERKTLAESLCTNNDRIKFDICPICQHEDFVIFINEDNEDALPCGNCFRCGFNGDIWALFKELGDTLVNCIEEVWDILENGKEDTQEKNKKEKKHKEKKINMKEIEKILEEAKGNNNMYMQKQGFTKAELEELEIFYRSGKVLGGEEADDFRYRVIYTIRDKDGNIVGLHGRSIWDSEEERKEKVKRDEFWQKMWNSSSIQEKVKEIKWKKMTSKIISTQGFKKSEHLYLLWKYTKNAGEIRKVVIVEGTKDAARLYCRKFPGIAVVAVFGNSISRRQMELLAEVFGKSTEIVLALDADEVGVAANVKAWKQLKNTGFEKVRFAVYPKKDKRGNVWKDFGEMVVPRSNRGYFDKLTREMEIAINRVVASPDLYLREMEKAGIVIQDEGIQKIVAEARKEEAQKFREEANAVYIQSAQQKHQQQQKEQQQEEQQKQKQQYKTRAELEAERRRIWEENFEEPYMSPEEEYRIGQGIVKYLLEMNARRKAKKAVV